MSVVAGPLTLPRGWPRHIRSAAVHAVSLSNFALTTALGCAAQILARAGLHIGPTTVRRMLRENRPPGPCPTFQATPRTVTARKPNDLWHVDLTTVPTSLGFWVSWVPFALPQAWPFCWWLAVAIDHCSRRVMGFAVFRRQPTSAAVRGFLERLFRSVGHQPR